MYAVLGHPVAHSLSPRMHNAAWAALGRNAVYLAFDVPPERLMLSLEGMRALGFGGVNLTVPLKETAYAGISDRDPSAEAVGAVNTVEFTEAGMRGHNTDGYGILAALREAFGLVDLSGESAVILGSGGAGRALAITLAAAGVPRIRVTSRSGTRSWALAGELTTRFPGLNVAAVEPGAEVSAAREASLILQVTPVGLHPGDPPALPPQAFRKGQRVLDTVYSAPLTATLQAAAAQGAAVANGLGMLLHQGVRSFEIWTGLTPPVDIMRRALEGEALASPDG